MSKVVSPNLIKKSPASRKAEWSLTRLATDLFRPLAVESTRARRQFRWPKWRLRVTCSGLPFYPSIETAKPAQLCGVKALCGISGVPVRYQLGFTSVGLTQSGMRIRPCFAQLTASAVPSCPTRVRPVSKMCIAAWCLKLVARYTTEPRQSTCKKQGSCSD